LIEIGGQTRYSWDAVAQKLFREGYCAITVDTKVQNFLFYYLKCQIRKMNNKLE